MTILYTWVNSTKEKGFHNFLFIFVFFGQRHFYGKNSLKIAEKCAKPTSLIVASKL